MARLMAQALVCRDREHAPCGECPACVRAKAGSHPDIRVVRDTSKDTKDKPDMDARLRVEALEGLWADAQRMPDEAPYNVYILLLGDDPVEVAQNKLLKLIEEPPPRTVFLMVCRQAALLLPTIRSRVQLVSLVPPPVEEAARWLMEHTDADEEEAMGLSQLCGGNIGLMLRERAAQAGEGGKKSLALADAMETAKAMALALTARGGHDLLAAAGPLLWDRDLCRETLPRLELIFRDACILRSGGMAMRSGAPQEVEALTSLPMKYLLLLPGCVQEYRRYLERNASQPLMVTQMCTRLREIVGRT